MDDQGGSRGRHAAEPDGPNDAESASGSTSGSTSGLGAGSGAHRAARPPGPSGPADGPEGPAAPEDPAGPDGSDDPTGPNAAVDPEGDAPGSDPSTADVPTRGRVRQQDPATTRPRPPSVAEQRARREAQRRERAQAEAAQAAEERKRTIRKRVLIGGGVAVGLVAVVAIVYAASQPDEVEAQCTNQQGVVVDDRFCSGGTVGGSYGGVPVPIFLGGFGNQYHYNYGSRSPIGTIAQGGTTRPPSSGASVRSGTSGSRFGTDSSGTVSRGGLGVGGSSSSGSSSGSSGSSGSGS